jgi:hypothetical protein
MGIPVITINEYPTKKSIRQSECFPLSSNEHLVDQRLDVTGAQQSQPGLTTQEHPADNRILLSEHVFFCSSRVFKIRMILG